MVFGWTAAPAIVLGCAILVTVGLLTLAMALSPPGRVRQAFALALAVLGLILASLFAAGG